MRLATQALFLHDRLIAGAFDEAGQEALQRDIQRRRRTSFTERDAHIGALQDAAARLLEDARELSVAGVEGDVEPGELISLTQDLYIRRASEEEGRFRAKLDTDRRILIEGRFSRSWLVGSTGRSESFGHSRLTMLAYVGEVDLGALPPHIELRPVFFGWRLQASASAWAPLDDMHVVWAYQIDQFSKIRSKRASASSRPVVSQMPERDVKKAFAEIVGEPYVEKDWPGETSDLFTDRLSIKDEPVSAAFAFKGPGLSGTLHIAGMGKRGDQAVRLATEPADILVVQHHAAIGADVRNLMSALARQHAKRFMIIDGETTALIFREYGKLPG